MYFVNAREYRWVRGEKKRYFFWQQTAINFQNVTMKIFVKIKGGYVF